MKKVPRRGRHAHETEREMKDKEVRQTQRDTRQRERERERDKMKTILRTGVEVDRGHGPFDYLKASWDLVFAFLIMTS